MSIKITDSTSALVVGYYKDKGTPHVETITIPATGKYGEHTLTIPATAGLTQAEYVAIFSVGAAKTAAVWFDIDAAGTAPTGALYGNTDYQIEVNIATGDTNIQNAAAVVAAIAGETGFTDVTIVDNLDGTITFTQDVVGWAGDFLSELSDDSDPGNVTSETVEEGLAGITQGDYIVIENSYGIPLGLWFDVDADGTSPSGQAFIDAAGDGSTQKIDIATGDTNVENAANVVAVVDALDWANPLVLTDNEDGSITITHLIGGAVEAADPHNIDDTGVGSITTTLGTQGEATTLVREDSFTKGTFSIVADKNNNILVFNAGASTNVGAKGKESTVFKYADIVLPTSTSLFNLKTQLDAFNVVTASAAAGAVIGEAAKPSEFTGTNDTFTTTFPFVYQTEEVFYNQVKMTRGVDYNATPTTGTIVFTFDPDPTLNAPAATPLTFNYIKA